MNEKARRYPRRASSFAGSRSKLLRFIARKLLLVLAALFIAAFAILMLTKTRPYYTFKKGENNLSDAKVVGRKILAK